MVRLEIIYLKTPEPNDVDLEFVYVSTKEFLKDIPVEKKKKVTKTTPTSTTTLTTTTLTTTTTTMLMTTQHLPTSYDPARPTPTLSRVTRTQKRFGSLPAAPLWTPSPPPPSKIVILNKTAFSAEL